MAFCTQKKKINKTMRLWEKINLTRREEKQLRIKKESNSIKTTK
jgi:hypothetical protein